MSRTTLEIILQILTSSKEGMRIGAPSSSAGSNEVREILEFLVKRKLLERRRGVDGDSRYRITDRGVEFLQEYEGLRTLSAELCKSYGKAVDVRVRNRGRRESG